MKIILQIVIALFFIGGTINIASGELISNGDFENSIDDGSINDNMNGAAFTLGTSETGEWYALSPWSVDPGGPSGSSFYFDHTLPYPNPDSMGLDQRAYQPVDTSSMLLAGAEVTLTFDYIFEPGDWDNEEMGVAIVGLSGSGAEYRAWSGGDYDGYPSFWDPLADVATARDVYGVTSLATTSGWVIGETLTVTLSQDYDALIAVFRAGAYDRFQDYTVTGTRGIDNVSMKVAPIPEPGTMLLFGTGIAGLAAVGRRKK